MNTNSNEILTTLRDNDMFEPDQNQEQAWKKQITILQSQLHDLESGHILFEYTIPRMGKRVDTVLIYDDFVFVMEFKVNKIGYPKQDEDQCIDYALDLKNFHKESHCASIIPILVSTEAETKNNTNIERCKDGVYDIAYANKDNIINVIKYVCSKTSDCQVTPSKWEKSEYRPTPTITEAAMALCSNISGLEDITRSDDNTRNLGITTDRISKIIKKSKKSNSKSICFVTGVPGSGKTLAGLNIVCGKQNTKDEKAILLSGNLALVNVLKESLKKGGNCLEKYGGAAAASLIQHIPKFRETAFEDKAPLENIVVFDEAQRAWSAKKLSQNMKNKDQDDPQMSDPELLITSMDRHDDWAVIVCMIGEGQEIYDGEVGLAGWLEAIKKYPKWSVYHPKEMESLEYIDENASLMLHDITHTKYPELHLGTSIRSFRGENLAMLVKRILDCDIDGARKTLKSLENYPIVITRDIEKAKQWMREQARGTARYGIIASSGAERLKPYGIYVRNPIKPTKWFLADKNDMRSSYYLEDVGTEFYIQGLEMDWACLAWDANFRYENGKWSHYKFFGNNWRVIRQKRERTYLLNSYRVLLTRARQGIVIFVPKGDKTDKTRYAEFYDGTYAYLKDIGLEEI